MSELKKQIHAETGEGSSRFREMEANLLQGMEEDLDSITTSMDSTSRDMGSIRTGRNSAATTTTATTVDDDICPQRSGERIRPRAHPRDHPTARAHARRQRLGPFQ